jgi:hypothetical protein
MEHVAKFGWVVIPQPLYRPDMVSSEFHLFDLMRDGLCGQHFPDNSATIESVRKWVASSSADFYELSMEPLVHC